MSTLNDPQPMTKAELHIQNHASVFTSQERFRRIRFSTNRTTVESIVIDGYVANVDDFHALKDDWAKTNPPCITSVFVHVDPQR